MKIILKNYVLEEECEIFMLEQLPETSLATFMFINLSVVIVACMLTKWNLVSGFVSKHFNKGLSTGRIYSSNSLSDVDSTEDNSSTLKQSDIDETEAREKSIIEKLTRNQQSAPRLSFAEISRTLIDQSSGYGVLSTISKDFENFPSGSIVGFAVDDNGSPFFAFSSMSSHTRDLAADAHAALTVTAKEFKSAADGRVSLIGRVNRVPAEAASGLRERYLARHRDAHWVDFGDFNYYSMSEIVGIRLVGGFGTAGNVSPADYAAARPDPLVSCASLNLIFIFVLQASFSSSVIKHMNDDHRDSIVGMVKNLIDIPCTDAEMTSLDQLGITVSIQSLQP